MVIIFKGLATQGTVSPLVKEERRMEFGARGGLNPFVRALSVRCAADQIIARRCRPDRSRTAHSPLLIPREEDDDQ